jgi:thiamine-monophosphate kinase
MGAEPRLALLSFALPPTLLCADFDRILAGLALLASAHRIHVAGGNLTSSPGPLMLDVTATGTVKRRSVLTRRGAKAKDEIYVTGTVGAGAAGLQYFRARADADGEIPDCGQRYLYPEPRVRTGMLVGRSRSASACMDLSDGLADAVRQVSEASGVGVALGAGLVPIDPSARHWFESRGADPFFEAIGASDDYELLFTVSPRRRRAFLAAARSSGVPVTRIGVCTSERDIEIRGGTASALPLPLGFTHFR